MTTVTELSKMHNEKLANTLLPTSKHTSTEQNTKCGVYIGLRHMVESLSTRWCYVSAYNIHTVLWCPRGAA